MNKIALINTYCDTEEKLDTLREMINEFKSLNVDIFVYSPLKLPEDIENICKFLFYTDENPILRYPVRGQNFWWRYRANNFRYVKLERMTADYGWASLYQFKKLANFALTYEYDIFYLVIYDVKIDDYIKNVIKNNEVNIIHSRKSLVDERDVFPHALHFTPLDRETLIKVEKYFDYDKYINTPDKAAEDIAILWEKELGLAVSEKFIYDKIKVSTDLYNFSKDVRYKLYANNDKGEFKFIFRTTKDVNKIIVNDKVFEENIEDNFLHLTGYNVKEIETFKVITKDGEQDYTDLIKQNDEIFKISYEK